MKSLNEIKEEIIKEQDSADKQRVSTSIKKLEHYIKEATKKGNKSLNILANGEYERINGVCEFIDLSIFELQTALDSGNYKYIKSNIYSNIITVILSNNT